MLESKFKNGFMVWSPVHGWGTAEYSYIDELKVVFHKNSETRYFTRDGRETKEALLPTLFLDEVKLEDWPNPPAKLDPRFLSIGQEIEVKLAGHEGWTKRLFAGVIFDKVWVFSAGKDVNSAKTLQNPVEFRLPVN